MRRIFVYINIVISLFLLLGVSACVHETDISVPSGQEEIPEDKVRIEIFTRAKSYNLPATRAVGNEYAVGMHPWVFVFRGEGSDAVFVEAVQAFELIGKRYVLLTRQTDGSRYQLLILANPVEKFYYGDAVTGYEFNITKIKEKIIAGTTKLSDVCRDMMTAPLASPSAGAIPYSNPADTIPMSYLLPVDGVDNSIKIENSDGTPLGLTRAIAKLVLVNTAPEFTLKGITAVVNVPRQGRLHNLDVTTLTTASGLTEYQYDAGYSAPVAGAAVADGGQSTKDEPVYLYESATGNNTYLIIQGTYANKDYYYKMAVIDKDGYLMDILRNREYTFTISKVKGPGYDTVEDAKASKASNTALDFRIQVDESDAYEIIANNDYFLGVSNSVFMAYTNVTTIYNEAFSLITDCTVEFPDARTITDNSAEIAPGSFRLESPADGKIPIVSSGISSPRTTAIGVRITNWLMWYEDGIMGDDGVMRKNGYITLKLGNLEKQVHIRQRKAIAPEGTVLKFMPTGNTDPTVSEVNYFCLTGRVEEEGDNPKSWIKLRPSTMVDREDTGHIIVEDGKIFIQILPNEDSSPRTGSVSLATITPYSTPEDNRVQRIKINITQLGKTQ